MRLTLAKAERHAGILGGRSSFCKSPNLSRAPGWSTCFVTLPVIALDECSWSKKGGWQSCTNTYTSTYKGYSVEFLTHALFVRLLWNMLGLALHQTLQTVFELLKAYNYLEPH